ncbi:hypothetical protein SEA_SONALI_63 [Arthrobacter phage Sonali]|uniref:Uncharacterized protein n=1 Tax=Arthrobacter phage Sonali TaxID=2510495 RepID=A0A411CQH6_9CAUD|nr:hypothetical protein HOV09_gp63 [Arthrobacter phage Sonali]QAY16175.1 hypothetical protein SEA_SONALI_63 [Arthrobacter phage Sonali]
MSRRADAPQTTNADTPRAAELRLAARECIANPHPGETPTNCPLVVALPAGSGYDEATTDAVTHITGRPIDNLNTSYLRSSLRRWAMREQIGKTPVGH